VLNTTIAAVEASAIDRIIIVVGFEADVLETSIEAPRSTIVRNSDFQRGNMSSLMTAVSADSEAEAFILVPGDLPGVRTGAIDSLIDLWHKDKPWAAVTEYQDQVAHPFLLSREAVVLADEFEGEKVLGGLLVEADNDRVLRLPNVHRAPRDVNTPEDYDALIDESTNG
jgi:CTP:molybdopterin cytidylyltransferase MocA